MLGALSPPLSMDKVKLVRMANQIAANLDYGDEPADVVADRVADHLSRFWDPVMRRELLEYSRSNDTILCAAAKAAVERVQR